MFDHVTVLLNEAVEGLNIKEDGIYVDCTLGGGGHSCEILKRLTTGHLYCFDQDFTAIEAAKKRLGEIGDNYTIIYSNFVNIKEKLEELNVHKVDGILFDLGVSSPQFDTGSRGFSYNYDSRLDMRMDINNPLDAYYIVNSYDVDNLCRIFRDYGEEKFAYPIAKKIIEMRRIQPIETTFQLVDIIKQCLPNKVLKQKGHPAKKIFQALRIEVNQELDALDQGLNQALAMLNLNGICSVITFQSLEDRFVKHLFKEKSSVKMPSGKIPLRQDQLPTPDYELLTRKSIVSGQKELETNNRAHSARLRSIRRIKL